MGSLQLGPHARVRASFGSRCEPVPPRAEANLGSAELSHSLKVSDRRRKTPKSAQNPSESWCASLWAPCRVFWAWFCPALRPNSVRDRRFPAGSLQVFRALLAQPSFDLSLDFRFGGRSENAHDMALEAVSRENYL